MEEITSTHVRQLIKNATVKYYYLYKGIYEDEANPEKELKNKVLAVSVCLMNIPKLNLWARGVAICSPLDNPNKVVGRTLARANAAKLLAAKLIPGRSLHRTLTDEVKLLLELEKDKRPGIPSKHTYVPTLRFNMNIQSILNGVNITGKNVMLTDENKNLENELQPMFTPHETAILTKRAGKGIKRKSKKH
jgi:hypothetical protein